jgi:drug/metabolite transporter (DMT)-like permease
MLTLYLVWGSTYLAIRVSVRTVPPLVAGGVRFLIAGLLMVPVLAFVHRGRPGPSRRELLGACVLGLWLLGGGPGLVTVCEAHVPSNLAAVIASLAAVWVVVYRLLGGERLSRLSIAAVLVGFAGVAVLLAPSVGGSGAPLGWLALTLLVPVFWSSGSYYGRRLLQPRDPFVTSAVEMTVAGAALTLAGLASGERVGDPSAASLTAIAYLVIASLVAFSAYVWLLGRLPISTVVTHQYVNPLVAVLLAAALLGEPITPSVAVGGALVIGAVAVILREDARAVSAPA